MALGLPPVGGKFLTSSREGMSFSAVLGDIYRKPSECLILKDLMAEKFCITSFRRFCEPRAIKGDK